VANSGANPRCQTVISFAATVFPEAKNYGNLQRKSAKPVAPVRSSPNMGALLPNAAGRTHALFRLHLVAAVYTSPPLKVSIRPMFLRTRSFSKEACSTA
jgi:hypothetical protein